MTDLSPAAEATLNAAWNASTDTSEVEIEAIVAAALRAAADQVAPDNYKCYTRNLEWDAGMEARTDAIREDLLAIADELESQ